MKKIISIVLTLSIIIATLTCAVSARQKCDCGEAPVIYVEGQGEALFENPESEDRVSVDDVLSKVPECIPKLILGFIVDAFSHDHEFLADTISDIFLTLLGKQSCDKNGDPLYNVGIKPCENPTADMHFVMGIDDESIVNVLPKDYAFRYDWRLDPLYNAELLNDYIEAVKSVTGHDKVRILCHSEGNNVTSSYLSKYGYDSIDKIVFLSPAFQGISLVGSLFSGEHKIDDKGSDFARFFGDIIRGQYTKDMAKSAFTILEDFGTFTFVLKLCQKLLNDVYPQQVYDTVASVYGSFPGFWSFCPDEYYELSKERMFSGKEGYEHFIEIIDDFHYNVQNKVPQLIEDAVANGVEICITAGYDISTVPLTESKAQHSDYMIDTKYMTIGATCAPLGETFPSDYTQAVDDGHNHISPDRMIDASTCRFPEYTWFIRGQLHNDFGPDYCKLLFWMLKYDGQPTVFSNSKYPQFLYVEDDGVTMHPVTQEKEKDCGPVITFAKAFIGFIASKIEK